MILERYLLEHQYDTDSVKDDIDDDAQSNIFNHISKNQHIILVIHQFAQFVER